MAGDIYVDAVADARQLRAKATAAVERQLVEKFKPRIEEYIERVLLEDGGDSKQTADDDDILLGVDNLEQDDGSMGAPASGPSAADVEASLEVPDEGGEAAAISVNQDGTVTLELDKMVVDAAASASSQQSDDETDDTGEDVLSSLGDVDGSDVVVDGEQHESVVKLRSMLKLSEHISDADAKLKTFVRAARVARTALNEISSHRVTAHSASSLTSLAECVRVAYATVKGAHVIPSDVRNTILSHFEATYGRVNGVLAEAIQDRVSNKLTECGRTLKHRRMSVRGRNDVVQQLAELRAVVDAVTDRGNVRRSVELRDRITKLMREAKRMSRRGRINEEDVTLRLSLPDDGSADAVRAAFAGDDADAGEGDAEDDVDIDALLADDGDEGDDDGAGEDDEPAEKKPKAKKEKKEEAVTRAVARLFEADDPDESDDESDDDDGSDDDEPADDDDDDPDAGSDGSDALERVVDVLRDVDGDVQIELVDDVGAGDEMMGPSMDDDGDVGDGDMDMGMDDDVIDVVDDTGGDKDDDDEIVEVDMAEVSRAIREMDTGYHRHETPGPGDGIDSFGDADEDCEPFTDPPDVRRESRRRASGRRLRETYSDEYENAMMGPRGEYYAARSAEVNSKRGGDRIDFLTSALLLALDEYDEFHEENTGDDIDGLISDLVGQGLSREEILGIDSRIDPVVVDEYLRRASARGTGMSEGRHRRLQKNSGRRVARRPSAPVRGMAARRGRLAEGVGGRQQGSSGSNLLQMKLLNANRILQRSDLTPLQRKRVMRAMDEARNLGEVKALYTRLTQALDERRGSRVDRRHRSAGTSSQVLTSSGVRQSPGVELGEGSDVFTESIDIDMWKRHAGILED